MLGLRVLLDHHHLEAKAGRVSTEGLWYSDRYDEDHWIALWRRLAERYRDDWTVVGADLHNEPYEATWGDGSATDWPAAAERSAEAIHRVAPEWLIVVEGSFRYQGVAEAWRGENFRGFRDRPIRIARMNKLVLSPHLYGPHRFPQVWFEEPSFPDNLPTRWREVWSFLEYDLGLPVVIGEFDVDVDDPKDRQWLDTLFAVLEGDASGDGTRRLPEDHPGMGWFQWAFNWSTDPRRGLLESDGATLKGDKLRILEPHLFTQRSASLLLELRLSAEASDQSLTVRTEGGSALVGVDFLPVAQTVDIRLGTPAHVRIPLVPDSIPEADEVLRVQITLASPPPGTPAEATFDVRIQDDDR